ncbi:putative B box-type domain-containing protein [Seiridium cardinale]
MFAPQRAFDATSYSQLMLRRSRKRRKVQDKTRSIPVQQPKADSSNRRRHDQPVEPLSNSSHDTHYTGKSRLDRNRPSGTTGTADNGVSKSAPIIGNGGECHLCGKQLGTTIHVCQSGSVSLCSNCVINSAVAFPGQVFKVQTHDAGRSHSDQNAYQADSRNTIRNTPVQTESLKRVQCWLCEEDLIDYYRCQECSDAFCVACRQYHPVEHTFQAVSGSEQVIRSGAHKGVESSHGGSDIDNVKHAEGSSGDGDIDEGRRDVDIRQQSQDGSDVDVSENEDDTPTETPEHVGIDNRSYIIQPGQEAISLDGLIQFTTMAKTLIQAAEQLIQRHQGSPDKLSRRITSSRGQRVQSLRKRKSRSHHNVHDSDDKGEEDETDKYDDAYDIDEDEGADLDEKHDSNEYHDLLRFYTNSTSTERRASGKRRKWLSEDMLRLRELKDKGWTDERIAAVMGRSPSAIMQQWRKQN